MACSVSAYVHNHLKQYAAEVDNFIFQELNPPATKDIKEANAAVYGVLKTKSPININGCQELLNIVELVHCSVILIAILRTAKTAVLRWESLKRSPVGKASRLP